MDALPELQQHVIADAIERRTVCQPSVDSGRERARPFRQRLPSRFEIGRRDDHAKALDSFERQVRDRALARMSPMR